MAYSEVLYTGDGVRTDYGVPFEYLDQSHVHVAVNKVQTDAADSNYKFEFLNSTTIRVRTVVNEDPVPSGTEVRISRKTPIGNPAVVFGGGASLSSANLNKNSQYLTFALQEATDTGEEFSTMYLGSFFYLPTTDNQGNPLKPGAVHYNTEVGELYYYTGSIWKDFTSGPRGPAGPAGQSGPTGPAGPEGSQGPTGPQGVQSPRGDIGPVGATGSTGVEGPQGEQGVKGDQGLMGPQGPQGVRGETGLQGPTGAEGPQGPQGIEGETGQAGPVGPIGPEGPTGTQGIQGPTGLQGPKGTKGDTGDAGPTGPTGPQGIQGPTGEEGPQGLPGDTGDKGPTGDQGAMGATPLGLAFGRFFLNDEGELNIEYYGDAADNDFTIDENGFLSVTTI